MNKTKLFIIQLTPVLYLVGYIFMHAIMGAFYGGGTHMASIAFNGVLLALSLYVIAICSKDFYIEKRKLFLSFFSVLMILYALRMVLDVYTGPFSNLLPHSMMWNDVLQTVGGAFFPAWAMIASRKYLDIQKISTGVFWAGAFACFFIILSIRANGLVQSIEDDRLDVGGSLHSLALARIGAIEVLAAIHMLFNGKKNKLYYLIGLILGVFVSLASGARGAVFGVIAALAIYAIMSLRKKPAFLMISVIVIIIAWVNFTNIITWVGNYFPVVSYRMLETVKEGDLSNRDILYDMALDKIAENPLTGYGYRLKADDTGYGPHNGILDVFLCLGVPIGILFVIITYGIGMLYSMRIMIDRRFVFPSMIAVFSIVSSLSASSLPAGNFDFAIVFVGVAYYYHFGKIKQRSIQVPIRKEYV